MPVPACTVDLLLVARLHQSRTTSTCTIQNTCTPFGKISYSMKLQQPFLKFLFVCSTFSCNFLILTGRTTLIKLWNRHILSTNQLEKRNKFIENPNFTLSSFYCITAIFKRNYGIFNLVYLFDWHINFRGLFNT